jgi:hypothetical protein
MSKITVKGSEITILKENQDDYICLTDMIKNMPNSHIIIGNWLRLKDTIEYLGLWEGLNNPKFKLIEFDEFKQSSGSNRFTLSPEQWIIKTNAIGMLSKSGRNGGTYAHRDIAFHFAMWISPEFHLMVVQEFQKLKEQETKYLNIEWDYRRFLTKVNYRIHTDAIKDNIIPVYNPVSKSEEGYIYASEAELLNMAVFGTTSKQWRSDNPELVIKGLNIRDVANIPQLTVLSNLESYHSMLIKEGLSPKQRLEKLKEAASTQLKSLSQTRYDYPIESPIKLKYEQNSTFDKDLKGLLNVPPERKD